MELNKQYAAQIAQQYQGTGDAPQLLGWGIGGFVYLSPVVGTVVKVHRGIEGFTNEVQAYQLLRKNRLTSVNGFAIPRLRAYRTDLKVIEMDFVIKPFLVDFAGALFSPPDFSSDVLAAAHAKIARYFGPNAQLAYLVYDSLAEYGLYYVDFRDTNLKVEGHPFAELFSPSDDDGDDDNEF